MEVPPADDQHPAGSLSGLAIATCRDYSVDRNGNGAQWEAIDTALATLRKPILDVRAV